MLDTDQTVQNNYQRIIWRLVGQVTTPGLQTDQIMADTIGDLQESMAHVFGDIQLDALVAVQGTGTFTFTKGMSRNFLYENLSAGEKAAFDLLLDVVVNKAAFNDSLYCVDEPEAHLSTKLQGTLLNEMYGLVPGNSQLWLATHSIGMVRTAQEIYAEHPEQVVFLDMGFGTDGEPRDYDQPQIVEPAASDHAFWMRHYSVALDDMARLLAPDHIVLCEGSTEGDDPALDESCYNRIFAREFPRTRFVSVGCATQVEKRMGDLLPFLERIVGGSAIVRFRDRDDLTPAEIEDKHAQGVTSCPNTGTSNRCCFPMAFCGDSAATSARLTASTLSERPETALWHVPVANRRTTTSSLPPKLCIRRQRPSCSCHAPANRRMRSCATCSYLW